MSYGENFRNARKDMGFTQMDVARKLNIHQSNISDWENDISRPEYENLVKIATLYKANIYELLNVPEKDRFYN